MSRVIGWPKRRSPGLDAELQPVLQRPFAVNGAVAAAVTSQKLVGSGSLEPVQLLMSSLLDQSSTGIVSFGFYGTGADCVGFWRPDETSPFQLQLQDSRTGNVLTSYRGRDISSGVSNRTEGTWVPGASAIRRLSRRKRRPSATSTATSVTGT